MSEKNNTAKYISAFWLCVIAGVTGVGINNCATHRENERQKYIVTAKGDNRITYVSVEDRADLHVMEFDGCGKSKLFYRNINLGDTISGQSGELSKAVANSCVRARHGHTCNISNVNGKTVADLILQEHNQTRIAQRDSIMRQMKQKQR